MASEEKMSGVRAQCARLSFVLHTTSLEIWLVHLLECADRAGRIEFVVFHTQTRAARLLVKVKGRVDEPRDVWQVLAELTEAALNNARAGNLQGSTWAALTDVEDW